MINGHENMAWILVYIVFFIFSTIHAKTPSYGVSTAQTTTHTPGVCYGYGRIYRNGLYMNVILGNCCNNFYKKNGVCVDCPIGSHSKGGGGCKKCENGYHGKKCASICSCNSTERCDHVLGCVSIDDKTGTVVPTDKRSHNDVQEAVNSNVVTYMTCVAVGSVLVVVCGLIVKNREAICRRKPSNKAIKTKIKKRKWSNFSFGKANVKDKKESLYADINEKDMLNLDGE
ncbi:uncharacterized protein LOC127714500 [Mytilus californianus]|uniref:uncharacterized protein LOC127714500 n=1 Tax=Mytilus californianus TaxID=6549 RepID=UPI00224764D9|nr:uncharacterized protein LOC127714500 [Mytilus californianus]